MESFFWNHKMESFLAVSGLKKWPNSGIIFLHFFKTFFFLKKNKKSKIRTICIF